MLGSHARVEDCRITGNTATGELWALGGGMHFEAFAEDPSEVVVSGCHIEGNEADVHGGGVVLGMPTRSILEDCVVVGNQSQYAAGVDLVGPATIRRTVIARNIAETRGGGFLANRLHSMLIHNCTVVANEVTDGDGGGAILGSLTEVRNCIFWNNDAGVDPQLGKQLVREGDIGDPPVFVDSDPLVEFCDIEGGFDDDDEDVGIIDEDPLFVDAAAADFRLTVDSPCIDVGDPDFNLDPDESIADLGAFPYEEELTSDGDGALAS